MAGNSTVYDVKVRYALDDKASKGASGMASHFDKANNSAMSLKGALAAIGGIAVLGKAKSALIDFNSDIDQMKTGLTAVMQMNLHMPFAKARTEADRLFSVFQEMAKKSPATTKDFMEMGNAIAPAVAQLGGGVDEISKLAQGGVLASVAFGERSDVVARDIKSMLKGQVSAKDPLAQQLISSRGMEQDVFNAMDPKKRAKMVMDMLQDPALLKAADVMGDSMKGQISTLEDTLQIALGNVGKPLMASITDEVRKMNSWIEKHPKLIAEWGSKLASTIKGAFEFVKGVANWLVENKETLFTIGKTFLLFKGAQMGTNIIKSFKDGIVSMADGAKNVANTLKSAISGTGSDGGAIGGFGRLGKILSVGGPILMGLTLFGGALKVATDLLNTHAEDDKKARAATIDINEAIGDIPEMMARRAQLKDQIAGKGVFGGMAKDPSMRARMETELEGLTKTLFDPQKMGDTIRKISDESKKHGGSGFGENQTAHLSTTSLPGMFDYEDQAKSKKVTEEVMAFMKSFNDLRQEQRDEAYRIAFPEQFGMTKKEDAPSPGANFDAGAPSKINVNIHKVEVASEDPDRFVFGLAKIGEQAAKHQTSSQHAMPGGL